jgi:hypothetical protein
MMSGICNPALNVHAFVELGMNKWAELQTPPSARSGGGVGQTSPFDRLRVT